jgi:glycosyltransferase involved in cell wall biosynthesis
MTSFDVIVPCYNYARYLRQCVESVLLQQGVKVRVLIIDDCSPDNTPEIGGALAAEDSRVEYRRHETNLRHIATYNEGFEWAVADGTLLLSADDWLTPGSLERVAKILARHADFGLVWGRQIVCNGTASPVAANREWGYKLIAGHDLIQQMCRTGSNPVMTPTAVVRTTLLRSIGGYDPSLPHSADRHYWMRCAARAAVAVIDAEQAYKRMHGENMQVEYVSRRLRGIDQQWRAFELFFEREASFLPDADRSRDIARRSIANQAFWAAHEAFESGACNQCDELLAFARDHDPELPNGLAWTRFAWKRRLGSRFWNVVRPLIDRLRKGRHTNQRFPPVS